MGSLPSNLEKKLAERLGLYFCGVLLVGPALGTIPCAALWAMSWVAGWNLGLGECWSIGWLVTTVLFCADVRERQNPTVNFLQDPTADRTVH